MIPMISDLIPCYEELGKPMSNVFDQLIAFSGHPFVILEDKENHRHIVPAPDPSESSDVSSDTNRIPNGMEIGEFLN